MPESQAVTVKNIREGDSFVRDGNGWTATADAVTHAGQVSVQVQYVPDGGIGYREWDDPEMVLEVERA